MFFCDVNNHDIFNEIKMYNKNKRSLIITHNGFRRTNSCVLENIIINFIKFLDINVIFIFNNQNPIIGIVTR